MPKKDEKTEDRCPNCGYCPHCGQSARPTPYYPPIVVRPIQPVIRPGTPYWGEVTWGGGKTTTVTSIRASSYDNEASA